MSELVVIAALFDGVRVNKKLSAGIFTPEWGDKLYRGCRRNWDGDFRLVMLTDYPRDQFKEPVECVPYWYKPHRDSWMGITEVFRPDMPFDHAVFMGLDTIITGSLEDIGSWRGDVAMVRDPWQQHATCNALVSFRREAVTHLWDKYIADPVAADKASRIRWSRDHGSEMVYWRDEYEGEIEHLDEWFPGQLLSYKVHVRKDPGLLPAARVVYFHGKMKPHEVNEPWVSQHWR